MKPWDFIENLGSDEKLNIRRFIALNTMNRGINYKRNHENILYNQTEFKMMNWKKFMKNLEKTDDLLEMAYKDMQESLEVVMGQVVIFWGLCVGWVFHFLKFLGIEQIRYMNFFPGIPRCSSRKLLFPFYVPSTAVHH